TPEENARKLVEILKGEGGAGRDLVAMNSGAAIYVSGKVPTLRAGCDMAEDALSSGLALNTLQRLVEFSGNPARLERFL
ncbi:MAG: anthranilate phosphoribosyltransferase, partial [Methanosarcinales archaeon]|nr:anthranilate phosphoribosyltransferase [Methanosarcinales archaeon]